MGADWLETEIAPDTLALTVDQRVYSVHAVLRTAYWFTDRCYLLISKPSENTLRVHLKAKPVTLESPRLPTLEELAGEFGNALLDHQLREEIEERTGRIRELLVTKAIGEAGFPEDPPPGSPNDPVAEQQAVDLVRITPSC